MTNYFEHLLQLPLSYHGGSHSGRLMKVMLTGTDSLWWLWLIILLLVARYLVKRFLPAYYRLPAAWLKSIFSK